MARNVPKQNYNPDAPAEASSAPASAETAQVSEVQVDRAGPGAIVQTPMNGGTVGIIPEAERRVMLHDLVARRSAAADVSSGPVTKRAKRYVCVGNKEVRYLYEGTIVKVMPGKIFLDSAFDIELLQRQGVPLELLPDEVPEEESPTDDELAAVGE